MALTMYQASVPVFSQFLSNYSALIDKAIAHAEAREIHPAVLVNARLYPDMHPFSRQVQIASDSAKGCVARLAGVDVPSFPDTETTFAELKERIAKTIDYAKGFKPEKIDGSEDREIALKFGQQELRFPGSVFLTTFSLPNFFFHVATGFNILRHNGVEIGKRDYLGGG